MASKLSSRSTKLGAGAYDAEIVEAMARAMFVTAWADREEEKGRSHGGHDLMDVAPKTSKDALIAARALGKAVVADNHAGSLTELYERALSVGGKGDARVFGHYLAMEAMGHGVSWYDNGNPEFGLKLPHFEYYSGRGRVAQKLGYAAGRSGARKAPKGPASGFGREKTAADIRARIEWETWAAAEQRRLGHEAHATGHDFTRESYQRLLAGKGRPRAGLSTGQKRKTSAYKASCACTATAVARKKSSKKPSKK